MCTIIACNYARSPLLPSAYLALSSDFDGVFELTELRFTLTILNTILIFV